MSMHEIKTVSYQEFWNRHEEVQKQNKQLSITCGIQTQILTKFLTIWPEKNSENLGLISNAEQKVICREMSW
mgnify:CR=1 FL=1